MAEGWKLRTRRPDPKGGPELQGLVVVRVADQGMAVALAVSRMQDAIFQVDSEASAEFFDEYDVKPGHMLVLMEGQ